jgi:hypothetical protein
MHSGSRLPLGKYNRVSGEMINALTIDVDVCYNGRIEIRTLIDARTIICPEYSDSLVNKASARPSLITYDVSGSSASNPIPFPSAL